MLAYPFPICPVQLPIRLRSNWFLMRSAQNHDAHWQLIDPVVRTTLNYININDDRNLLMNHSLPYGSTCSCTGTVSATH